MKAQTFELNRCYNADCMKAMAAFPDGYFDLAVVDPPYFSGPERRGFYGSRVSRIGVHRDYPVSPVWEVPGKEYFDELMRVSRHYIIWGCNYFRLSIIIKRTETQLSRLCVFSLLQPHRTEVRLTGKYRYLTFEDRKKIEAWHLLGDRPVDIAARLSVHHTTIYKELQRGATGALDANQREGYSAELAERRLRESFKRRGKRAPAAQ